MTPSHKDREHAVLAPSAAHRWFNCPGSMWLSRGIISEPSEAAIEGTIAHEWAEKLRKACEDPSEYASVLLSCERHDEEMAYYCDAYVDFLDSIKRKFVNDHYSEFDEFVEQRVKFSDNIWGTLDWAAIRIKGKTIEAVLADFKYGRGVYVSADTIQLLIYLLCLRRYLGKRIKKAWVYVYQPRYQKELPHERCSYNESDIDEWEEKIIKAEKIAVKTLNGDIEPVYNPGDHCQFCLGQLKCKAFKAYATKDTLAVLEAQTLPAVERVPLESLIVLHRKKKQIQHFLQNVDNYLIARLKRNQKTPGLKLIQSRTQRKWKEDTEYVAQGLRKLGANPFKKKLIGIGEAEKIAGKNKINHLTERSEGKLQLVDEDDERPEIDSKTFNKRIIDIL